MSSLEPASDFGRSGSSRIISSATTTKANEIALAMYAQPTWVDAISKPPSDGPATDAVWNMIVFRLIAFGRCSRGTRVGNDAADHREDDDRDDANEADHAEGEPLAFGRHEQRHVPQQCSVLHHRAGERDEKPDPDQPEVAVLERDK